MEKTNEENKKEKDLYILKIGTNALIDKEGNIRDQVITEILESAKEALQNGKNILIVSSGAVVLGRNFIKEKEASKNMLASVGQPLLFSYYQKKANELGIVLAEFLISRPYIIRRDQFLNLQNTCNELLSHGIIPIVNENDALVSGTDWSFRDNDGLACALSVALKAKKYISVSHVDGLFDDNPDINKNAKLIKEVFGDSDYFLKYTNKSTSSGGTGGMFSKLKVARICNAVNIEMQIINGTVSGNIMRTLLNEKIGTIFFPRKISKKVSNRDRWILAAKNSAGSIEVDDGAEKALLSGMSLLAVGVKKIYGQFEKNEIVEVVNKKGQGIAFGIINLSNIVIEELLKNNDTKKQLLIHSNNIYKFK